MSFQKLLQPLEYSLQMPAKSILSRTAFAYNYWLKVPADKFIVLEDIVHNIHNSQLL